MAIPADDAAEIAAFKRAQARATAADQAAAINYSTPVATPSGVNTSTAAGVTKASATGWTKAGTVQTANGPVDVNSNGIAQDGSLPIAVSPTVTNPTSTPAVVSDSYSKADVDKMIADAVAKATATNAATQKAASQAATTTALEDFRANLKLAGLDTLVDTIDGYIKQDMTASQIKINLVSTQAYKDRFPGMAALAAAGRAVNEATYISMERGYEQVLGAYGLDTKVFGTREKLGTYIAGEVSPAEFENRVQIAADRVEKNPDVLAALKDYYGVDKSGAVAYLLDPTLGMDIVKKQARAAEIGAAAQAAGFSDLAGQANVGVAESFINASGTQDLQALKTQFGNARILANTQERLAQIENGNYKDTDAITAVLGQDAQKIMESQKRAAREVARFSGSSGVGTQSLRNNATSNI